MKTESSSAAAGQSEIRIQSQKKVQNEHSTKWWAWVVATFFGVGFGRPGPGTWGSVAAVLLWGVVAWGLHLSAAGLLLALVIGIALDARARRSRSHACGTRKRAH